MKRKEKQNSLWKTKTSCIIKAVINHLSSFYKGGKNMKNDYNSYLALDISRYVINKCNESGNIISNLKLQKILYFIQGNFYRLKDRECFVEDIHAWNYGPVVPEIYREYKHFGSNNIPCVKEVYSFNEDTFEFENQEFEMKFFDEDDKKIIDEVVEECQLYSANALVSVTHRQQPWKECYRRGCDKLIEKKIIEEYFKNGES